MPELATQPSRLQKLIHDLWTCPASQSLPSKLPTPHGYPVFRATTGFYVDWGAEDNGILTAFLGHLKKSLPKVRVYHPADQVVPGASEA